MSRRFAIRPTRRDLSEPAIVEALQKAGWEVHKELPVDLLLLKRTEGGRIRMVLMDAKTARGKKAPKARIDKRQEKQNAFVERWDIPKPTCPEEALKAAGEIT